MLTQTDTSYRKYGILCTSKNENCRAKMKTVESFEKHYSFIITILFYKNTLSLTEENKKPEPCRQHSTMSFKIKY